MTIPIKCFIIMEAYLKDSRLQVKRENHSVPFNYITATERKCSGDSWYSLLLVESSVNVMILSMNALHNCIFYS